MMSVWRLCHNRAVHLTDPANIKANKDKNPYSRAYNTEKPAFEAEIKARKEYRREN